MVNLAIEGGLSRNGYRSCSPMLRLIELTAKVSGSHASIRRFKSPSWAAADAPFLEPQFLDIEVQKIDRRKAAPWPAPRGAGETILDGCR